MDRRGEHPEGRTEESKRTAGPRMAQPACPSLDYTVLQVHSRRQVCRPAAACSCTNAGCPPLPSCRGPKPAPQGVMGRGLQHGELAA